MLDDGSGTPCEDVFPNIVLDFDDWLKSGVLALPVGVDPELPRAEVCPKMDPDDWPNSEVVELDTGVGSEPPRDDVCPKIVLGD